MPVTLPDVSNSEIKRILQVQEINKVDSRGYACFGKSWTSQYGNRQQSD
jgi:hypothetical protein